MSDRVTVTYLTAQDCRDKIEGLLTKFPMLRPYLDAEGCECGCDVLSEIGNTYGWGYAVPAWEEIESLRWLLGDE